jgi:hypothetical protein
MRILLASLALGAPVAANATTSWTIYSGDGQTSQSGTGSGSASIDGADYNFSFTNTNSPTIIVTGGGTGGNGSHFDATYDYTVFVHGTMPSFIPTSCSQGPGDPPCRSPYSGNYLFSVLDANGEYYLSGPNAYLQAYVAPGDNYGIASCDSNLTQQCGYAQYTTTLGASGYGVEQNGDVVFVVPVELRLRGDLFGGTSTITAAIDPILTLNPDFVADSGLQSSDFTIDTNGNGNASNAAAISALAGAVPEPASWAMMLCGFGVIGAGVRRRRKAGGLQASL